MSSLLTLTVIGILVLGGYQWIRLWRLERRQVIGFGIAAESARVLRGQIESAATDPPTWDETRGRINQDLEAFSKSLGGIFSDEDSGQIAPIKRILSNGSASQADLIAALLALERILQNPQPLLPRVLTFHRGTSGQTRPEDGLHTRDFSPSDAALLATVTEKFYGSWTFRIVGGMLIAAALFAVAGSVVIGDQTLNLRQELRDAGAQAEKTIDDLQKTTGAALSEQSRQIEAANDTAKKDIQTRENDILKQIDTQKDQIAGFDKDMAARRSQLFEQVDRAKADVDEKIGHFTQELKGNSVAEVVAALGQDLKSQESAIAAQILVPLQKIQQNDLTDIRTRLSTLDQDISDIASVAKKRRGTLDAVGPTIDGLDATLGRVRTASNEIESKRSEAQNKVNDIATSVKAIKDLQSSADSDAKSAAQSSKDASRDHNAIGDLLKHTEDESKKQLERIGGITKQGDILDGLVLKLTDDAKTRASEIRQSMQTLGDTKKLADNLVDLQGDLRRLQKQINDLGVDAAKPAADLAKAKHELDDIASTTEELKGVQLRISGFQPVVDGIGSRAGAMSVSLDNAANELVGVAKSEQMVHEATVDLTKLRAEIDDMTRVSRELEQSLDGLQPSLDKLKARVAEKTAQLEGPAERDVQQPRVTEAEIPNLNYGEVIDVQKALANLHLYVGRIDGILGTGTSQAIRKYQNSIKAEQTGKLTPTQRDQLLHPVVNKAA